MKTISLLCLFLTLNPTLYAQNKSTQSKVIQVQQLSPQADLTSLNTDYSVKELKNLPAKQEQLLGVKERDELFAKVKLNEVFKKYDQLDRDIIFHTIKNRGVDDCIRKYPALESYRQQLQKLHKLISAKK